MKNTQYRHKYSKVSLIITVIFRTKKSESHKMASKNRSTKKKENMKESAAFHSQRANPVAHRTVLETKF